MNCWDEESYFEPSELDEKIEELKEELRKSVRQEIKDEIEKLRKENRELQDIKKNFEAVKRDFEEKKAECDRVMQQAEYKASESIGTSEECLEAMQTARACQVQYLDNIKDPLEPLKISSALKSELLKLQLRKAKKPEDISVLDYTVIAALKEALEKRMTIEKENGD